MLRSALASMSRWLGLASDNSFILDSFHEFLKLGALDANCAIGGRHDGVVAGDQNLPLVAVRDPKALAFQFRMEGGGSGREGAFEPSSVEVRGNPLGTFSRNIGKTLDPCSFALGARSLHMLAVVRFVAAGEVFKAGVIVAAIKNAQGGRVHFRDGDVEMTTAVFDMTHDQLRAIWADVKLCIDRPNECR